MGEKLLYALCCVCIVFATHRNNCFLLTNIILFLGCAGSLFLCRVFSSCSEQVLFSGCSMWTSQGGGFSRCRAWALDHEF